MKEFSKKIQEQFDRMCSEGKLFQIDLAGLSLWKLYLDSFEDNPKFRDPESSVHHCNTCHNFIRRYGNIVSIDSQYKLHSIFDVDTEGEMAPVVEALSKAIEGSKVDGVFFETFDELNSLPYEKCTKSNTVFRLGIEKNLKQYNKEEAAKFGVVKEGEIKEFNHMSLTLPAVFVDMSSRSIEAIMGDYRDNKNVFKRGMDEIPLDTLNLVRDLINQGSLLDGQTHLYKVEAMIPLKAEYDQLSENQKDNWCWVKSYKFNLAKFKNELIGTLCSELAEGKEINEAAQSWNKRVDPINYMKTTAPITKKQIQEAKAFVEENGYVESFDRRFAHMDDIKVSEILHSNVGKGEVKSVSIFDGVKSTSTRHKRAEFDKVEEVTIDKFMKDILPTCTAVEAFFTSQQQGHLVSLTTANNPESKPIFKWSNNYSWTFNGNLAGRSQIKEAVKGLGGKVDGVLRFSIMWAEDEIDNSDLDAHCIEPGNFEIYFGSKISHRTGGNLDIDITQPQYHKKVTKMPVVENITYPALSKMLNGTYHFLVNQWAARQSKGFKAEIEFNGELYSYEYNKGVLNSVSVAEVTLNDGVFTIKHLLPESEASSKEIYSLETNQFHKVNLICLSPNHWEGNSVGNKHYFFMMDGCKAPTSIRSFHNENLIPDLANHRKVLEVLGATNMIQPTDKQLSGLGYNATVKDELVVRLSGTHKRVVKIKF